MKIYNKKILLIVIIILFLIVTISTISILLLYYKNNINNGNKIQDKTNVIEDKTDNVTEKLSDNININLPDELNLYYAKKNDKSNLTQVFILNLASKKEKLLFTFNDPFEYDPETENYWHSSPPSVSKYQDTFIYSTKDGIFSYKDHISTLLETKSKIWNFYIDQAKLITDEDGELSIYLPIRINEELIQFTLPQFEGSLLITYSLKDHKPISLEPIAGEICILQDTVFISSRFGPYNTNGIFLFRNDQQKYINITKKQFKNQIGSSLCSSLNDTIFFNYIEKLYIPNTSEDSFPLVESGIMKYDMKNKSLTKKPIKDEIIDILLLKNGSLLILTHGSEHTSYYIFDYVSEKITNKNNSNNIKSFIQQLDNDNILVLSSECKLSILNLTNNGLKEFKDLQGDICTFM